MTTTYCDTIYDTVISNVSTSIPKINDDKLPLLNQNIDKSKVDNDTCPLCGGSLTPMGWFRNGGLNELLYKCDICGIGVFRDVS